MVIIYTSYSLRSRVWILARRQTTLKFLCFYQSLQANFGAVPWKFDNRFLTHTFQFIISSHSIFSTLYNQLLWKIAVK